MAPHLNNRALFLANPKARRGSESLRPVIERLKQGGLEVIVEPFEALPELARDIVRLRNQADLVIVCGGDGSVSSSAVAAMESGLPLGIIPMGTANDLARTLAIPMDLVGAAGAIVEGNTRRVDVGTVNGHAFFNVASIGLSTELTGKARSRPQAQTRTLRLCGRGRPSAHQRVALRGPDHRKGRDHRGSQLPDRPSAMAATMAAATSSSIRPP